MLAQFVFGEVPIVTVNGPGLCVLITPVMQIVMKLLPSANVLKNIVAMRKYVLLRKSEI